jgi:ActR/RegA family two-component response regulator
LPRMQVGRTVATALSACVGSQAPCDHLSFSSLAPAGRLSPRSRLLNSPLPFAGQPEQGLRVQLIDPDAVARRRLAEYLRAAGLDVQVASDGAGGLAAMRKTAPAVLILDPTAAYSKALMGVCRRDARLQAVRVLLLSAEQNLGQAVQELAALAGLAKPIDLDVLLAVIVRVAAVRTPVPAQTPRGRTWSVVLDERRDLPKLVSGCTRRPIASRVRRCLKPSSRCGQLPRPRLRPRQCFRVLCRRSTARR